MQIENDVPKSVIRRLPRYYRFLYDLRQAGVTSISSRQMADRMGLTASQVRQDFNCFGGFGQQGYGYHVESLYKTIGDILGMDRPVSAVLVGAGNLGHAVAEHMPFEQRGFRLAGVVDASPDLFGKLIGGQAVRPVAELEDLCLAEKPQMAVLCIPKEAAPAIVKRLIAVGVTAFWNFSHYDILRDHPDVTVENVHLGDSLMVLSYQMKNENR